MVVKGGEKYMNIKKMLVGGAASAFMLGTFATAVFASPNTLNWGTETNAGECEKIGKPIVNVTQKVINDVDSGFNGYWAFDNYNRHIQVWESTTPGEYCAIVRYTGQFDAQAGQSSPDLGSTNILDGDEDGAFEGGYRATITGTLDATPAWNTRGSVGSFDYDCDLSANCPGYVSWVVQYFNPGYVFAYDWWGWIYHAGNNGSWVNSSEGNSGGIL